jgi:predicted transcriptional regulator
MRAKAIKVGIMPYENFKKYTMAIACGKYKPKKNEPKIWFESIETMSQVLNTQNVELLHLIEKQKPQSIKELAELSGRQVSNLSRTLKTFCKYGIVDLIENRRTKVPVVKATRFNIEYGKKYPSYLFDDYTFQAPASRVGK